MSKEEIIKAINNYLVSYNRLDSSTEPAEDIYYVFIKPLEDENAQLKQEVLSFENLNLEKLIIIQDKDAKIERLHKQVYELLNNNNMKHTSRIVRKQLMYRHQPLISDFNDLFFRIKLFYLIEDTEAVRKVRSYRKKPTSEEMDSMHNRVMEVLEQETYDPIKR